MGAEDLKKKLKKRKQPEAAPDDADFVSTGLTLINLGCSGSTKRGLRRGHYYMLVGESSSGKAQPLTAKVLTPTGWTTMGQLEIGQKVVDPDGGVGEVLGLFPQGQLETYKVSFTDGSSTECSGDHLWLTETFLERQKRKRSGVDHSAVRTTAAIASSLFYGSKDRLNHSIPMTIPVEYEETHLPMAPYLLGVLLGNGLFGDRSVRVSTTEPEIVERIKQLIPSTVSLTHRKKGDYEICCKRGQRNALLQTTKELGLAGCRAATKFIPRCYFLASVKDRIDLLNGLMDTDGYACCIAEYSTVSNQLANDIQELVESLGGQAKRSKGKYPIYTYKGERRIGQLAYSIKVKLPKHIRPFSLTRKNNRYPITGKGREPRRIESVELLGKKECQCILVSTQRHLYITDHHIVTHNTWLAMQILAEAAINPVFKDYRLILDNPERGNLMDVRRYFGDGLADRLEPPVKKGHSETLDEFYDNVKTCCEAGPCIYVLDSEDALDSEKDLEAQEEAAKARAKDKEVKGSFGMAKAKTNSTRMRSAHNVLEKHGSILVLIKQTRDNTGWDATYRPKTRSGGKALTFYGTVELWFEAKSKIRRRIKGKERTVGRYLQVTFKKNRISGNDDFAVMLPFHRAHGFDEVGSLVDYCVEEGKWDTEGKEEKKIIHATDFGFAGLREDLIQKIESEGLESDLRLLVTGVWREIEAACSVNRKTRYGSNEPVSAETTDA